MNFISGADLRRMDGRTQVNGSMTYLYGLSDFWVTVFQDKDLVDSLLEVSTVQLSEAYSQFLQRAANISVQSIQESFNSELKLLLLSEKDSLDQLSGTTYRLPEKIAGLKYIMNRPLLPTISLTEGVHFEISEDQTEITFYTPLNSLGFPTRVTNEGLEQTALWLSNVSIDEGIIYRQFGRTVGMTKERAIGNYRDFVEGLYFLYSHGPIIDYTIAGVNLALGIPTARATERVLSVLQDPITGHWEILTPLYYYEIPYGFDPEISVGDEVTEGQQLTSWVDVKDYLKDGKWWYNTFIPKELTGGIQFPPVTKNSDMDHLMQEYLRFNTFMVLFKQAGISLEGYYTVSDVIFRARPSHTYPIFVWAAPMGDEIINIIDDDLKMGQLVSIEDNIWDYRIISTSCEEIRILTSPGEQTLTTDSKSLNIHQGMIGDAPKKGEFRGVNPDGLTLSGIGGWVDEANEYVEEDAYRINPVFATRGTKAVPRGRSTGIRSYRGHNLNTSTGNTLSYKAYDGTSTSVDTRNLVPLYICHISELQEKLTKINQAGTIDILKTGSAPIWVKGVKFQANYDDIIVRVAGTRADEYTPELERVFTFKYTEEYIPPILSKHAGMMYVPKREDLPVTGGLILAEIYHDCWSVSMIITSPDILPTYYPVDDGTPIEMKLEFEKRPGSSPVNRTTYLANPALLDARSSQYGYYNDGVSDYSLVYNRSGDYGEDPLRAFIRRD